MLSFILRRAGLVVPTFLGITLLVFALIRLIPGDPVEALSGERESLWRRVSAAEFLSEDEKREAVGYGRTA